MVETIDDMPAGTVGFRASGKLTRDDYRQVMEPGLRAAAEAGDIRMLGLGIGHHSAWKRSAIVSDVEWLTKAFKFFAWMTPGEVEVFGLDRLEDAKGWVAEGAAAA